MLAVRIAVMPLSRILKLITLAVMPLLQSLLDWRPFSHAEMAVLKLITSAVMPSLHIL